MKLHAIVLALSGSVACTTAPSTAVVRLFPEASGNAVNVLLALPTACVTEAADAWRCAPAAYVRNRDGSAGRPMPRTFAALIDPLLRTKLELAGFTLADAETLRLETAERTERTTRDDRGRASEARASIQLSEVPNVAALPPEGQRAAARSLGLQGIVTTTLRVEPGRAGRTRFTLALELQALPGNLPVLTVNCSEFFEFPDETATVLANCVGNGVLAARAPDALIGKLP